MSQSSKQNFPNHSGITPEQPENEQDTIGKRLVHQDVISVCISKLLLYKYLNPGMNIIMELFVCVCEGVCVAIFGLVCNQYTKISHLSLWNHGDTAVPYTQDTDTSQHTQI